MGNNPVVFPFALALASALYSGFQWSLIPDSLPVWWNLDGSACYNAPKWVVMITLPILQCLIPYVICLVASYDSNLQQQAGESKHAVAQLIALPAVFLCFIEINVLNLPGEELVSNFHPRFIAAGIAVWLLFWLGYNLQYVEPNSSIGILTPWTTKNARVWKWTHTHAGDMLQWCGVALVICAVFVPAGVPLLVVTLVIWLGSYLYAVTYSWMISDAAGSEVEVSGSEVEKPLLPDEEV